MATIPAGNDIFTCDTLALPGGDGDLAGDVGV
jgi:hypothetical protein